MVAADVVSDPAFRAPSPPASPTADHTRPAARWAAREVLLVIAAWLVLVASSLLFPVTDLPNSPNSWDVLHSGRQFAERGFRASHLQPRWMPLNDPAPYLTYTHYPPLPYWISGVVQSVVRDPQARIRSMEHLIRLVGLTSLVCAYVLLRVFGIGVGAAALSGALLAWSQRWWMWSSAEMTWISWLPLYLLAGVAALAWGLGRARTAWRVALLVTSSCFAAAALSAFDAWLWIPTFLAALFLLTPRRASTARRRLLCALALGCAATGIGVGTRLAINWWHFGSLSMVARDLREAYQVRSAAERLPGQMAENAVNYANFPEAATLDRWGWIRVFYRTLPRSLVATYGPETAYAWWVAAAAVALALPTWWSRRLRRGSASHDPARPSAVQGLVALTVAPVPFVLACPAINAQQTGGILVHAPAVVLLCGLVLDAAVATIERAVGRFAEYGRSGVALLSAMVALALVIARLATPYGYGWMVPIEGGRAAAQAIAHLQGVIFVNTPDTNPLMFLLPIDSAVALKPLLVQPSRFYENTHPVRVLVAESPGGVRPDVVTGAVTENLPGLPAGWSLIRVKEPTGS